MKGDLYLTTRAGNVGQGINMLGDTVHLLESAMSVERARVGLLTMQGLPEGCLVIPLDDDALMCLLWLPDDTRPTHARLVGNVLGRMKPCKDGQHAVQQTPGMLYCRHGRRRQPGK